MHCIFCKKDSSGSRSVEHIIPESLGNTEHILPREIVCDACNQYFSLKVEKPVLGSGTFRFLRSKMSIPSKKGRIPSDPELDRLELPEYRVTGRFLGKIGLEALASRIDHLPEWQKEVVEKTELDEIRYYSRFDRGPDWPFSYRPIYRADTIFQDKKEIFEVLHEYDLLYTKEMELYIVVVLFGVEFALNLGGPELDGYYKWLKAHNFSSPLYIEKNID